MKRLLVLLLVIITGCNLSGGAGKGADITGTEGLTIKIGTVPSLVYLGQSFSIPVTIENAGTSDIEDAILSISGYNNKYIHLDGPSRIEKINLVGRTTFSPVGERTTTIFNVGAISLPDNKEEITQVFQIKGCYKYKTIANPVVCINPRLGRGEPSPPGSCDNRIDTLSPTQGAPIAVTGVTAITITNEPVMEFHIEVDDVSEKGEAILEELYAKECLGKESVSPEEIEVIKIEAFLSGQKLQCFEPGRGDEETDKFIIRDKGPSVICRAAIDPDTDPYTAVLSIQLKYGYVYIAKPFPVTLKNPAAPSP